MTILLFFSAAVHTVAILFLPFLSSAQSVWNAVGNRPLMMQLLCRRAVKANVMPAVLRQNLSRPQMDASGSHLLNAGDTLKTKCFIGFPHHL